MEGEIQDMPNVFQVYKYITYNSVLKAANIGNPGATYSSEATYMMYDVGQ
jgi:hypothetical protein